MNILTNESSCGLRPVDNGYFKDLYEETPEEFMKSRLCDYEENLSGKYVVSMEMPTKIRKDECDKSKWCFNILGIYTPREDQNAKLEYYGHISFISIYTKSDNSFVNRLYKDDECWPQTFNEWYENEIEWRLEDNDTDDGENPTKQDVIETIKLMIKSYYQNKDLEIDINKEDIIILQGL